LHDNTKFGANLVIEWLALDAAVVDHTMEAFEKETK